MKCEKAPLLSIIVPVYKVENYLPKCIDSILAQTFTDFELILVDDGSPDDCPALCDAAAEKDARVRVIHQKNGRLICRPQRRAGRSKGRSGSVLWIQTTTLHRKCMKCCTKAVQSTGADLALCDYAEVDEAGSAMSADARSGLHSRIFTGRDLLKRCYEYR